MSTAKVEKQKKKLVELGVIDLEDTLVDFVQASYVERRAGTLEKWKQGWAYFTEDRLIIFTGLLEENIIIPYKNISKLQKCSQSFLPIGIIITHRGLKSSKKVTDKISMMKRDKWLDFMAERAGITVS